MESQPHNEKDANSMLYINFNQDGSCFAVGTQSGFMILNSNPFKNNFNRDMNGGIGLIEMLNRSNILALIGGGKSPRYSANKLVLWDDHKQKEISEMRFMSSVKNVKMKKDRIFAVTEDKIYVFNFNTLELFDTLETKNNNKGIISISIIGNIIAYPDKDIIGSVKIKDYDKQADKTINAHKGPINFLQLNKDGTILATASDKGTLIRLFDTSSGEQIQELRRGTENAEIYSISFDDTNRFLAVSSDRKTVHIFIINKEDQSEQNENEENTISNKKSMFGNFANFFGMGKKYFNSEWSFAQFKVNSNKTICTFGKDNTIIVVSNDGKYYKASFDPKVGGECKKIDDFLRIW